MALLKSLKPYLSLVLLLALVVLGVAFEAYVISAILAFGLAISLAFENPFRRKLYLALASAVAILIIAPINTDLSYQHVVNLAVAFGLCLVVPALILKGEKVIEFHFWPKHFDRVDIIYTLISLPLAYAAFKLYFYLSPEVPFNWSQPPEAQNSALLKLFLGINAVGIWDELFFINTSYAIIRRLFNYPLANFAQAVIYTAILWDMAFRGVGPIIVYLFALSQGAMYERSKVLLWVLIVHMIVDYVLFQAIVSAHYPSLDIWWH
ncbi:MAG: hypothetical protein R2880_09615 [Deinococcales bacterium]